ncbi:MAG: 2-oxoacid:acceptor oxidoreductase subunit alpha, partial [Sulfuricaulis sp.]|nr:2-oxoacid:acceptor oxidoreductase subunit alpha [Sulfuricaulis sp.]
AGLEELLRERFAKKGDAVIQANLAAIKAGFEYAKAHWKPSAIKVTGDGKRRLLMSGNPAIGLGAVAAGCRFYSAYPMTPASSLLHWLVKYSAKTGVLVKQCEDEIAALNMAIGAAHVGARAMTGTSGGGFALMTEAVGEAAMTETPVVIVMAMRGGPSTGLPTKTEQGDLFQALGASQGDFPKVIFSPRTVEECYSIAIESFNLAEKYQCPVMILTDLYLAECLQTVDGVDIKHIPLDRGAFLERVENGSYRRFADTETGVSPRAVPGTPGTAYVSATDEHDEDGIVISDVFANPATRMKMMEKRMRKMDYLVKELPKPALEGPANADLTLVGWGSTYSVMKEAMLALNQQGQQVNLLAIRNIWPFQDEEVARILRGCKTTMSVEANFSGQLVQLIRMCTGISVQHHLRKYDGEPFNPSHVIDQARKILTDKPKQSVVATAMTDEGLPKDFSPVAAAHV